MHIELFEGRGKKPFRFRVIGENHEKVSQSQGYATKSNAKRGARDANPGLEVVDKTKTARPARAAR